MVDRINLIMQAKNLTARQFAEQIGVQPSNMSHILSGRNRPSLDFVMKVVNRYPEIDIRWLTLGVGEMLAPSYSVPLSQQSTATGQTPSVPVSEAPVAAVSPMPDVRPEVNPRRNPEPDLFSQNSEDDNMFYHDDMPLTSPTQSSAPVESPLPVDDVPTTVESESISETAPESDAPATQPYENRIEETPTHVVPKNRSLDKKRILKVVILYSDHTFSEYYPE